MSLYRLPSPLTSLPAHTVGIVMSGIAGWNHGLLAVTFFADSPLVKRDHYFAAGIGIAWILGESSTRVEAFE